MSRAIARESFVILFFLCLTIALTWPVAAQLTSALPHDLGDPLLICWAMGWNYHTLFAGHFSGFWDANILYPTARALALGEHASLLAFLGFPGSALSGNLVATYNVLFLLSFFLSGYAVYRLALFMIPSTSAALFAGIAFAFTTYRFDHIAHLNLLQTQWLVFAVLNFLAFIRGRKAIHAAGFTLFLIASALSSAYYLIFTVVLLAFLFPLALAGPGHIADRRLWLGFALAGVIAMAAVLPFVLPYAKAREDVPRSRNKSTAIHYSARPHSFVTGPLVGRAYAPWLTKAWRPETNFFPGFLPIILGLGCLFYPRNLRTLGVWLRETFSFRARLHPRFILSVATALSALFAAALLAARLLGASIQMLVVGRLFVLTLVGFLLLGLSRWRSTCDLLARYIIPRQSYRGFLLVMLVVAALFSMGPKFVLLDEGTITGPYYLLFRYIPGVGGLRVPARFAVFAVMALCVMAAYGFADVERLLARSPRVRWVGRLSLLGGILLESVSIPLATVPIAACSRFPPVYQWLANEPPQTVIAELPMGGLYDDVRYMYFSTRHWKRMVNGYNAYLPPEYAQNAERINLFPAPEAVNTLREIGVNYVIFHGARMGRPAPELTDSAARIVRRFGEDCVYELSHDNP